MLILFIQKRIGVSKMKIVLLIAMIISVGCASVHEGNFATQVDENKIGNLTKVKKESTVKYESDRTSSRRTSFGSRNNSNKNRIIKKQSISERFKTNKGMLISFRRNDSYNAKYYRMINFTFENLTSKWMKVDRVEIESKGKYGKKIHVLKGIALANYFRGISEKRLVDSTNTSMALGAITAAAIIAGGKGDAGGAAMVGAYTTLGSMVYQRGKLSSDTPYPSDHLLGANDDFLIPPSLTLSRYVVFYSENPGTYDKLDNLLLTYILSDGTKETVNLDIKKAF